MKTNPFFNAAVKEAFINEEQIWGSKSKFSGASLTAAPELRYATTQNRLTTKKGAL